MNAPLQLSAANASGAFPMDPFASAYMIPFLSPEFKIYIFSKMQIYNANCIDMCLYQYI